MFDGFSLLSWKHKRLWSLNFYSFEKKFKGFVVPSLTLIYCVAENNRLEWFTDFKVMFPHFKVMFPHVSPKLPLGIAG